MKKIRHFVAFNFKEDTSTAEVERICLAFRSLKSEIPLIESFEGGRNVSPENLNMGFSWGFLLTFGNEQGRDEYLVHDAHKSFVAQLLPLIQGAFVFDYTDEIL